MLDVLTRNWWAMALRGLDDRRAVAGMGGRGFRDSLRRLTVFIYWRRRGI